MELRAIGTYLPGLILFYLFTETGDNWLLALGLLSLLAAIVVHGIMRSVFGPGGPEENPLEKTSGTQRFLVAMTTKGPAKQFADNRLDAALNALSYWSLISTLRKGFWVTISLLVYGVLPVSTLVALYQMFPYLREAEFPVALLYVGLVVWILQNFVVWGKFPAVYLLEQEPDTRYGGDTQRVRLKPTTNGPSPDRPAKWMELRNPDDVGILEILQQKNIPSSPLLISYYYCRERSEQESQLAPVMALAEMWGTSEDVRDRLDELQNYGLVDRAGPDLYQISETGKAYIAGSLRASNFE